MGTKYKEVYAAIEKDIVDGRYDVTRKLNTEDAYIEEYNVSRNTIRNAIDLLIKRVIVSRSREAVFSCVEKDKT